MSRRRRSRRPRWFIITMLIILVYFGSIIISQGLYLSHVSEDQRLANERLAAAKAENDRLRTEKQHLGELPYIEKIAREELARGNFPMRRENGLLHTDFLDRARMRLV